MAESPKKLGIFQWWAVQDSNLRSREAPDLQSGVIATIRTAQII